MHQILGQQETAYESVLNESITHEKISTIT
jgi:hypothetical protein